MPVCLVLSYSWYVDYILLTLISAVKRIENTLEQQILNSNNLKLFWKIFIELVYEEKKKNALHGNYARPSVCDLVSAKQPFVGS